MLFSEAEHLVNKIISGMTRCRIRDVSFQYFNLLIKSPSRYHKYVANELYNEIYDDCINNDMFTDDELKTFMEEQGFWNIEKEKKMTSLQKDIEELKLRMFESSFNSNTLAVAKRVLKTAKADIQLLHEQKNSYNHLSASGFAEIEKNKFLIGMSLYSINGELFMDEEIYWSSPAFILEQALTIHRKNRIAETQFRYLARNEPWRSYWISRKTEGKLLGVAPVDLTDDQRSLIIWSTIYDNVQEHPEQPPQYVIEDDDVLDGWFIFQRRKREKENNKNAADQMIGNEKIRNSGEIFIPANSQTDLERVASLNDMQSDIAKRQRMNYVAKHKEVSEAQMPDTRQELNKQKAEMFKNFVKNGKAQGI